MISDCYFPRTLGVWNDKLLNQGVPVVAQWATCSFTSVASLLEPRRIPGLLQNENVAGMFWFSPLSAMGNSCSSYTYNIMRRRTRNNLRKIPCYLSAGCVCVHLVSCATQNHHLAKGNISCSKWGKDIFPHFVWLQIRPNSWEYKRFLLFGTYFPQEGLRLVSY